MTRLFILWFVAGAVLGGLFGKGRPELKDFDMRRCYAVQEVCWEGQDCWRDHSSPLSRLVCWPKNGCWLDPEGNAICWRRVDRLIDKR